MKNNLCKLQNIANSDFRNERRKLISASQKDTSEKAVSKQPTIMIAVARGWESRYLLRTDIVRTLKAGGARIVILVPNPDEDYIVKEFSDNNVFVEKFDLEAYRAYYSRSLVQQWLRIMRGQAIPAHDDLVFINDKASERRPKEHRRLVKYALDIGIAVLRRSTTVRRLLQHIESRIFLGTFVHAHLFEKYNPDLVVTCSPGYYIHEAYLLRETRKRGKRTASVIFGWDKAVSLGLAGFMPDSVVVWSKVMREEMIKIQEFSPKQLYVAGVATFDIYQSKKRLYSRDQLFERHGLVPERKLIVFGGKSPWKYPNYAILDLLAEAIAENRLEHKCQIIARLHPLYFKMGSQVSEELMKNYQKIKDKYPNIVKLSIPKFRSHRLSFDLHPDEAVEVGSLISNADVLVTMFSTLMVEACICNTPIVNVGFDPVLADAAHSFDYRSIKIDMNQPHNLKVRESGATTIAYNAEELVEYINRYLNSPDFESTERCRFAETICGPLDGQSGRRVGQFLLSMTNGKSKQVISDL